MSFKGHYLNIFLFLVCSSTLCAPATKMIVEIVRHGSRAPISSIVHAPWMDHLELYQLSPVGKRQQFNLGYETKNKFKSLFQDGLLESEMEIYSSQIQRTVCSAGSQRAGFIDVFKGDSVKFDTNDSRLMPEWLPSSTEFYNFTTSLPFGYQASSVKSKLSTVDNILVPLNEHTCPEGRKMADKELQNLKDELLKSEDFIQLYHKLMERYKIPTDEHTDKFEVLRELADFISLDWRNNPHPLISREDPLFGVSVNIAQVMNSYKYLNETLRRITPAGLFLDMISQLKKAARSGPPSTKFVLYATHDTMIAPILASLKVLDIRCLFDELLKAKYSGTCGDFPDTAASLLFELLEEKHKDNSLTHSVRFYYNHKPIKICESAEGDTCSFQEFQNLILSTIDQDYDIVCTGKPRPVYPAKPDPSSWRLAAIVMVTFFVIQCLLLVYCCLKYSTNHGSRFKKKKHHRGVSEYVQVDDLIETDP